MQPALMTKAGKKGPALKARKVVIARAHDHKSSALDKACGLTLATVAAVSLATAQPAQAGIFDDFFGKITSQLAGKAFDTAVDNVPKPTFEQAGKAIDGVQQYAPTLEQAGKTADGLLNNAPTLEQAGKTVDGLVKNVPSLEQAGKAVDGIVTGDGSPVDQAKGALDNVTGDGSPVDQAKAALGDALAGDKAKQVADTTKQAVDQTAKAVDETAKSSDQTGSALDGLLKNLPNVDDAKQGALAAIDKVTEAVVGTSTPDAASNTPARGTGAPAKQEQPGGDKAEFYKTDPGAAVSDAAGTVVDKVAEAEGPSQGERFTADAPAGAGGVEAVAYQGDGVMQEKMAEPQTKDDIARLYQTDKSATSDEKTVVDKVADLEAPSETGMYSPK